MIYLTLFLTFLKIGAVSFGGGYGMISLIRETVLENAWLTEEEFLNFIAVAESTPGPLGVNMATYSGFRAAGVAGALAATFGLVLPSVVVIMMLSKLLKKFRDNPMVCSVLYGIRPAVIALILFAGAEVAKLAVTDWETAGLFVVFFAAIHFYKRSPIFYIIVSAALGIALKLGQ